MRKDIEKVKEKYMYLVKTIPLSYVEDNKKKAYIIGYIDGYYKEHLYQEMIERDMQKYIDDYFIGYDDGLKDGNKVKKERMAEEKQEFVKKIIVSDALNRIYRTNFSEEAQNIYDNYMENGMVDLQTGELKLVKKSKKLSR